MQWGFAEDAEDQEVPQGFLNRWGQQWHILQKDTAVPLSMFWFVHYHSLADDFGSLDQRVYPNLQEGLGYDNQWSDWLLRE